MSTSMIDDNHEIEMETATEENDDEEIILICIITVILIIMWLELQNSQSLT